MKIISKFRDYYDGVSWLDASDDVQYLRHTRREKGQEIHQTVRGCIEPYYWSEGYSEVCVVVFCGKPYTFIKHLGVMHHHWGDYLEALKSQLSGMQGLSRTWRTSALEKRIAIMGLEGVTKPTPWDRSNNKDVWEALTASLGLVDWESFHLSYQSPVLLIEDWAAVPSAPLHLGTRDYRALKEKHSGHLIVNPNLRNINFAAVVPPDQAYQEIDMFVGNVLTQRESADRVRTSEEIRDAHGFCVQSFVGHQGPSKKERRRLNKKRKCNR